MSPFKVKHERKCVSSSALTVKSSLAGRFSIWPLWLSANFISNSFNSPLRFMLCHEICDSKEHLGMGWLWPRSARLLCQRAHWATWFPKAVDHLLMLYVEEGKLSHWTCNAWLQGHLLREVILKLHSFSWIFQLYIVFCEFLPSAYLNSSGEIHPSVLLRSAFESCFGLGTSQVVFLARIEKNQHFRTMWFLVREKIWFTNSFD